MKKYLYTIAITLAALCTFTSCDEDEMVGYNLVNGHWFGDLDMWYGNQKANGSEITFTPWNEFSNRYGTGVEIDYYNYRTITHVFDWEVRDGVIYLEFDDPNLDCVISDYSINSYRFRGWLTPFDSWTGELFEDDATRFELRDYDTYWGTYGYGNSYYNRYAKQEVSNSDALWDEASSDTTSTKPVEIRGRNRAKRLTESK